MGLFDELDVAGAADNPFAIPDDTYECVVSDVIVKKNNKGNMGMTVKYKVTSGQYADAEVTEYRRIPHPTDSEQLSVAEAERSKSFLKRTLTSLGIPEDRMNSADKADLVGIQCYVSTQQNGDFTNVRNVSLTAGDDAVATVGGAVVNPFA